MKFTKKELYEIEKAFDSLAAQHTQGVAMTIEKMSKMKKGDEYFSKQLFDSFVESHEMLRTISAKAYRLRDGDNDK